MTSGFNLWVWPISGEREPLRVVETLLNAMHGRFSPDGKWLAYASDELGTMQVFVQPFRATGNRKQISTTGGSEPRWRRDGGELYSLASDLKLMSVSLPRSDAFRAGVPQPLFETRFPLTSNSYRRNYAVAANGQRFRVSTESR